MNSTSKSRLCMVLYQFFLSMIMLRLIAEEELEYERRCTEIGFFLLQHQMMLTVYRRNRRNIRRKRTNKRRCWIKTRSTDWWDRIVQHNFSDDDWLENFRVSSSTFKLLCSRLRPYLEADSHSVREPATVEKKVAIALYKLASCAEYRVVANQFGTNKCVVHKYVYAFCKAVCAEFRTEYLALPNEVEAEELSHGFENICGIPNVIGAIDGTHIPVLPPLEGYRDFVNRKGWPSYNVLAVVDHLYRFMFNCCDVRLTPTFDICRFRYITCQYPGCTHDAAVLKDSNLYRYADNFIPKRQIDINGTTIPCLILGDPAYPLLPWLLKGFKGMLSEEEESFNVYHSRGRVVVENAFGRLKARFRCLLKRIDIHYTFVPMVVETCCILHNIVETRKETFRQNWLEAVAEAEIYFPQPTKQIGRGFDSLQGATIRETLKNYMTKYPLRTSRLR